MVAAPNIALKIDEVRKRAIAILELGKHREKAPT